MPYKAGEVLPSPAEYGAMVARVTQDWDVTLMFEPGRVIAGNAGVLLTTVIRVKRNGNRDPFVIVDAAMNDLARPALYGSWHDFDAVRPNGQRMTGNIVGPICETGDTFAMGREHGCACKPANLPCSAPPALMARRWPPATTAAASCPRCWSMATAMP